MSATLAYLAPIVCRSWFFGKFHQAISLSVLSHCRMTMRAFWERNLRLKVDGSNSGPKRGTPALVGAGMAGDRADVIFAAPEEISGFIKPQC